VRVSLTLPRALPIAIAVQRRLTEEGRANARSIERKTLATAYQKSSARISMLRLGGAAGGECGSSNAECAVSRVRPSRAES
jgi:hypothetical protein